MLPRLESSSDQDSGKSDGEVKVAANSKFGSIDMVNICPQVFTSNFSVEKHERLKVRIESFLFFQKECLSEFCSYEDLPCGLVTMLLNLFAFRKYVLSGHIPYADHLETQKAKGHFCFKESPDAFEDIHKFQKLGPSFKSGASANLDRLTLTCQGESFDWLGLDCVEEDEC